MRTRCQPLETNWHHSQLHSLTYGHKTKLLSHHESTEGFLTQFFWAFICFIAFPLQFYSFLLSTFFLLPLFFLIEFLLFSVLFLPTLKLTFIFSPLNSLLVTRHFKYPFPLSQFVLPPNPLSHIHPHPPKH